MCAAKFWWQGAAGVVSVSRVSEKKKLNHQNVVFGEWQIMGDEYMN